MKKQNFSSECEKMRYRALRDGCGSNADMAWRNHAKTCQDCNASLHILDLLNGQSGDPSYRIDADAADKLVQKARERYGVRKPQGRIARIFSIFSKVAVAAVLVIVASQMASRFKAMEWMLDKSVTAVTDTVMTVAAPVAHAELADNDASSEKIEYDIMLDIPAVDGLDEAIGTLGNRIDTQFENISNLIDADLNAY